MNRQSAGSPGDVDSAPAARNLALAAKAPARLADARSTRASPVD